MMEPRISKLTEARLKAGLTQQAVANLLGCSIQAYQNYEYGKRDIKGSTLVALASILGCTTDYLLGCKDAQTDMDGRIMKNLSKARRKVGLTQLQAANRLGVSIYSIQNWEQGKSEPSLSTFAKMAELYAVSTDELYGFKPTESANSITKDEQNLLEMFHHLTSEQKVSVLTILDGMQLTRKKNIVV